jgi:hypothetical protein
MIDLLEAGEQRRALRWANILLDTCISNFAIQMCVKHELEPLHAIPEHHAGFGPLFANGHYAAMREKIMRKRASYQKRLAALVARTDDPPVVTGISPRSTDPLV